MRRRRCCVDRDAQGVVAARVSCCVHGITLVVLTPWRWHHFAVDPELAKMMCENSNEPWFMDKFNPTCLFP